MCLPHGGEFADLGIARLRNEPYERYMLRISEIAPTLLLAGTICACHTDWAVRKEDAGLTEADQTGADADISPASTPQEGASLDGGRSGTTLSPLNPASCVDATTAGCSQSATASDACSGDCVPDGSTLAEPNREIDAGPAPSSCSPSPEACNLRDDDCDDVLDPALQILRPSLTRAWGFGPQATNGASVAPRLVAAPGVGAWLLYGSATDSGPSVQAAQFGKDGAAIGGRTSPAGLALPVVPIVGASHDRIVIATHRGGSLTNISDPTRPVARLSVFRSADLRPDSELVVFSGNKPCESVRFLDVAVSHSNGELRVAWIMSRTETAVSADGMRCDTLAPVKGEIGVWTATRNAAGTWSAPTPGTTVGDANLLGAAAAAIRAWPCGEGWALARVTAETGASLTHLDGAGRVLEIFAGRPDDGIAVLGATAVSPDGDCAKPGSVTVPLIAASAVNAYKAATATASDNASRERAASDAFGATRPLLRRWTLQNGGATTTDVELPSSGIAVASAAYGGATYVAMLDPSDEIRIAAVAPDGRVFGPQRFTGAEHAGPAHLSAVYATLAFGGATSFSLVHTGEAFVLAAARTLNSPATTLNSLRAPGDTDPPVAVTYTLGCGP